METGGRVRTPATAGGAANEPMSLHNVVENVRQRKALSTALILATLAVGILLGTVISTSVNAARQQTAAPDATPLTVPNPVQVSSSFSPIAKRLGPAVVNINSETVARSTARRRRAPRAQGEEEDPREFFRFFGRPFTFEPDQPQGDQRNYSLGSGVIVDPKGYIVTNNHVIEHADRVRVKLKDDTTLYDAKVVGSDEETDLAVIKIDAKKPLTYAKFGNSDAVEVGDWAIAIGSPFSFEQTMTAGIISAMGRESPFVNRAGTRRQFQQFIQTDAAINQGNSGGPLLNINGEVIGINTAIVSTSGGYEGIGFALPSNTAVGVYNHLIKEGKVVRGSIGIQFSQDENQALLRVYGAKDGGVLVDKVQAGGPAEKAGLKPEDLIVALNGKKVRTGEQLVNIIANSPVGTKINVSIVREGKPQEIPVTIGDRTEVFKPEMLADVREEPRGSREGSETMFGISVANLTPQQRERWSLDQPGGVLVTKVEQSSFAEDIGLEVNDVILSINRRPVAGVADVRQIQRDLKAGSDVAFRVMRQLPNRRGAPEWRSLFLAGVLPQR